MNAAHPVKKPVLPTGVPRKRDMTDQTQEYSGWIGQQVVDQAGDKVGKVVPVERVRLTKETVTGEETVNAELRKEEVDQDGVEVTDRES
jgi:hypothetical protein